MKTFVKILKWLGITLLVITAISFIFFSSHIHVERSADLPNDRKVVYNYLTNLHNFKQWSPWYEKDTNAVYTFSGPETSTGSSFMWKGNKEVGSGSMTITDVVPDSLVKLDLNFMENGVGQGSYIFADAGPNKTKMTWTLDFEAGANPVYRIMGAFMDKLMAKDFERGFEKLQAVLADYKP